MDKKLESNGADLGKDWAMALTMKDLVRQTPQKNLTPIEIVPATRKTHLVLVMAPEWGVFFPPYNIARLTAVTRAAGYKTTVFDINVKSWQKLKDNMPFDPWHHAREWMWVGKNYYDNLHHYLEPVFQDYVDKIVDLNPDVVGFSMYYTNEEPTNWIAQNLKKRLPNAKIICGGPNSTVMNSKSKILYDHIVEGEGEQVILDILNKIENNHPITEKLLKKDPKLRLDLDSMPFPDYTDYDLNDYSMPGGISSEISRGCVAKCVFCTEVHFWKYRGRMSGSLLDEVDFQQKHYGANFVWFIDSLVNGNLKELRGFCLGIKERGIKIQWQGYARCDGRMDLDYYKDLATSGCIQLSYGIESGSQKVLDAMKKEITVEEVESNLRDGSTVGIQAHTNWIVGFPNEDILAFADTLILIWRIKDYNIFTISPGLSLMLSPGAEMTMDREKFDINPQNFLNMWTTNDLRNTKVHRLVRMKSLGILLEHLNSMRQIFGFDRPNLKNTYEFEYDTANIVDEISREEFDYNIINDGPNEFANSLMNEIWALLRTAWRAFGPYKIKIRFRPKEDTDEFGDRLGCNYTADHYFTIDKKGNWVAEHSYDFKHINHDGSSDEHWPDYSFSHLWKGSGVWSG
jgi:anaerobic magnesium-protoporphyrin IX monomethyl ester cyclase